MHINFRHGELNVDDDSYFKYVFPIFRGIWYYLTFIFNIIPIIFLLNNIKKFDYPVYLITCMECVFLE